MAWVFERPKAARLDLLHVLPKGGVGAEIGVHLGGFSSSLLRWSKPRKLFLIDPWKYESGDQYKDSWYGGTADKAQELENRYEWVCRRFARYVRTGRVVILRQNSEAALADFEDGSLDYVYIDGNHLYEFVKKDLELSLRKVKSGGYITGDDYGPGGWWNGGVKKAVDEIAWREKEVTLLWIRGEQFVLLKK